jgi:glutathione synthase/RimK-type ligase-like ATP-grasp enzyme
MRKIIIVNTPAEWGFETPDVDVVSALDYLTKQEWLDAKKLEIFNLCKSYSYQSYGYYVSLLAEARGHKAMPSVKTIQDMKSRTIIKALSDENDAMLQKLLGPLASEEFTLSVYFGKNVAKKYEKLANTLFRMFDAPFLQAHFVKTKKKWLLQNVEPIPASKIPEDHRDIAVDAANEYFKAQKRYTGKKKNYLYDLAILVNDNELHAPSDTRALNKFIHAAKDLGINAVLLQKDDAVKISQFDALFIRETTNVNHHTYSLARKAEAEGLVVIDEPTSIMRCTNKVYLAELLNAKHVPTPKTVIIHKGNMNEMPWGLDLPVILKLPDSSFSQGVIKVKTMEECKTAVAKMLEKSALILAQEFMPTDYDWRVGVIDGKPLYVCKYYMATKHWQIIKTDEKGKLHEGNFETMAVADAPKGVISTALKACNAIGKSLYGVDIKQVGKKFYVIEVNDNPSIDGGVEDKVLKDGLYDSIMKVFRDRLDKTMQWKG